MRVLITSLILAILLATIGLGMLFDGLFAQFSEPSEEQGFVEETAIANSLAGTLDLSENRRQFVERWASQNNGIELALIPVLEFPLPDPLMDQLVSLEPLLLESEGQISIHRYLPIHEEVLILSLPLVDVQESTTELRVLFTGFFYVTLLILMLIWLYPLIRRLMVLRGAARAFGEGNLDSRVEVGSISYIADIEKEFNHMAGRIESLISDIKLLSSAVSHDLRTPLARIRFGIETLVEEDDPKQREYFQQRIVQDVDDMVTLVENLLDFARLEQNLLQISRQPVNLSALLSELVDKAKTDGKDLQLDLAKGNTSILADESFLSMMCNNLIHNALQHCDKQVKVALNVSRSGIRIEVTDDGPGVPADMREQILQPFIRVRQQDKKGFGLGLAIVKRVCEFHGGQVRVGQSKDLGGASFRVDIPHQ